MSQPVIRGASRVYRSKLVCAPASFFQQCRARSTEASQRSHGSLTIIRAASQSRPKGNELSSRVHTESLNAQAYAATSRSFSTSTHFYATVVAQNPRQDEEGQDMIIEISPRAAKVCTSHFLQFGAERGGAVMKVCRIAGGAH